MFAHDRNQYIAGQLEVVGVEFAQEGGGRFHQIRPLHVSNESSSATRSINNVVFFFQGVYLFSYLAAAIRGIKNALFWRHKAPVGSRIRSSVFPTEANRFGRVPAS